MCLKYLLKFFFFLKLCFMECFFCIYVLNTLEQTVYTHFEACVCVCVQWGHTVSLAFSCNSVMQRKHSSRSPLHCASKVCVPPGQLTAPWAETQRNAIYTQNQGGKHFRLGPTFPIFSLFLSLVLPRPLHPPPPSSGTSYQKQKLCSLCHLYCLPQSNHTHTATVLDQNWQKNISENQGVQDNGHWERDKSWS